MESATFKDAAENDWALAFTVGIHRTIKQRLKLDFLNVWDGKAIEAVASDVEKLMAVLWILCEAQAGERNITEAKFAESFTGDVLEAAEAALGEAITLFSPPAKRLALKAALKQSRQAMGTLGEKAAEKLEGEKFAAIVTQRIAQADAAMDAAMEGLLTPGASSTA